MTSENHFLISENATIFWYQKLFSDIRNYFLISEIIFDIRKYHDFLISEIIFWYQKIIPDIRKSNFWYHKIEFSDIRKSALKSYLAFHIMLFPYPALYAGHSYRGEMEETA